MESITITQISPSELETLLANSLRKVLLQSKPEPESKPDSWLNLEQLCSYHPDKPKKSTIYGWINKGIIPAHKTGKKLRFRKSEIDTWLADGKKSTWYEHSKNMTTYLKSKPGKP